MSQNHTQPTSAPQGIISQPTDGRKSNSKRFCTGEFEVIGTHAGFIIGAYENKDGSHGFVISDGNSSIWIDETKTIHIQTGATDNDGLGSGGLVFTGEQLIQKVSSYSLEIEGNDEEEKTSGSQKSNVPPFSVSVYGDVAISSTGGDVQISGDNILLNAKEQVKIKSGTQILLDSDGGGKIDLLANEVTTNAANVKYDVTGAFYVDGSEDITFNQKYKIDITTGTASVNSPGAVIAENTMGGKNAVYVGKNIIGGLGNVQISANKLLTTTIQGDSQVSLGPIIQYTLGQYEGTFVGTPRENSRTLNAYDLSIGGTVGTSYVLTTMDLNLLSLATITSTTVGVTDFIGTSIFLN